MSRDGAPESVSLPTPPPADADAHAGTEYAKKLDGWLEARKQAWVIDATRLALENARADTTLALESDRQDTQRALDNSRDDAVVAAERTSLAAIEAAYIATAQSTLDRVLTRANIMNAAVGTVITLYTGLLAFIYTEAGTATGGNSGVAPQPLQFVGLVPALFLALTLLLTTVYAALLRKKSTNGPFLPTGIGSQVAEKRLVSYLNWCFDGVLARRWALHAATTSLGVGIATLPLPFVETSVGFQRAVFAGGLLAVAATAAFTQWRPARTGKF